jgi:hypothetical protein
MSFATQSLRYGWVALAILVVSGPTIFVADNHMRRINTATRIEIILAVVERCLATQTGTNVDGTPIYAVPPPAVIRSWYSNSYESTVTNGVTNWTAVLHTNIMTNSIGWLDDTAMKNTFDNTIKALVPNYIDSNTLQALTVTGLWASLEIGDHTNQFTRTPEWTDTNGTVHAATFGPWSWRNSIAAWHERYKVLNALKVTAHTPMEYITKRKKGWWGPAWYWDATWDERKAASEANFAVASEIITTNAGDLRVFTQGTYWPIAPYSQAGISSMSVKLRYFLTIPDIAIKTVSFYIIGGLVSSLDSILDRVGDTSGNSVFDDNGTGLSNGVWKLVETQGSSTGCVAQMTVWFGDENSHPIWCIEPTKDSPWGWQWLGNYESSGYEITDGRLIIDWQFNYCTKKFW